MQKFRHTDRS